MAVRTAAAARPVVKSTVRTTSKTAQKSGSASSKSTAKSSAAKTLSTKSKTAVSSVKSAAAQSIRRDIFTKTGASQKTGIYSAPAAYKKGLPPAAGIASTAVKAAKQLHNALTSKAANARLNNISPEVMYCQTAGWWGDEDTGRYNCSYTAIATMASINLGASVKPNQVTSGCNGINAGTVQMSRSRIPII